jgi:hypothetical protein
MALYCTRRYDEAIAELKRNIELDPNFVRSYGYWNRSTTQKDRTKTPSPPRKNKRRSRAKSPR